MAVYVIEPGTGAAACNFDAPGGLQFSDNVEAPFQAPVPRFPFANTKNLSNFFSALPARRRGSLVTKSHKTLLRTKLIFALIGDIALIIGESPPKGPNPLPPGEREQAATVANASPLPSVGEGQNEGSCGHYIGGVRPSFP